MSVVGSWVCYFLRGGVSRHRGPASPRCGRVFLVLNVLALALLAYRLIKEKRKSVRLKLPFLVLLVHG